MSSKLEDYHTIAINVANLMQHQVMLDKEIKDNDTNRSKLFVATSTILKNIANTYCQFVSY